MGFISEYKTVSSIVLVLILLALRWLVIRYLKARPSDEDNLQKRLINSVKNIANALVAVGLIAIWVNELQYVALSIAAFAVALVLAMREFIQCLVGTLYLNSNRAFVVGDWIKVGDSFGEVAVSDWFSTTLLEVDIEGKSYGYTGKTLMLPNNYFITHIITNYNFMRRYVPHSFSLTRDSSKVNVVEASDYMLQRINEYCAPFHEVASRYSLLIEKKLGIHLSAESKIRIITNNLGKNVFTISLFCPTTEVQLIEQKLTKDFMGYWYQAQKNTKKSQANDDDDTYVNINIEESVV